MTDAELIAKLKVPPGCPYFRLSKSGAMLFCFRADKAAWNLHKLPPRFGLHSRRIAACVALQYWDMFCPSVETTDDIFKTKGQIDLWTAFGGFDK